MNLSINQISKVKNCDKQNLQIILSLRNVNHVLFDILSLNDSLIALRFSFPHHLCRRPLVIGRF